MTPHVQHFTTLDEYLKFATSSVTDYRIRRDVDGSHDSGHYGTETLNDALTLARKGWPDGSRLVRAQSDKFRTNVKRSQGMGSGRIVRSSVVGMAPNIPAYIAGRPDSMLAFRREPKNAPIVRILCSIGATYDVSADSMTRRGAAVCALIDLLESSGRRVEITMVSAVIGNAHNPRGGLSASFTVLLKAAHVPLDLDRIAFCLANPAMLRHITFSARDRLPQSTRREIGCGEYGEQMGTSCNPPADTQAEYNLYIGPIVNQTDAQAEAWLIEQLTAQGVLN